MSILKHMPLIQSIMDRAQEEIEFHVGIKCKLSVIQAPKIQQDDVDKVIDMCLAVWGTDLAFVQMRIRNQEQVMMRKVLCLLLKEKTKLSLRQIGNKVGYQEHTTVHNAILTARDLRDVNDSVFLKYYSPVKELFE